MLCAPSPDSRTHPYADGCEIGAEVRFFKIPAKLVSGAIRQLKERNFRRLYETTSIAADAEFERNAMLCLQPRFSSAHDVKRLLVKMGFKP